MKLQILKLHYTIFYVTFMDFKLLYLSFGENVVQRYFTIKR